MKGDKFITEINSIKPDEEQLLRLGLSSDYISNLIGSYTLEKKHNQQTLSNKEDDELLSLVKRYHCSTLEVGIISFMRIG
jgi:hypothetical protein